MCDDCEDRIRRGDYNKPAGENYGHLHISFDMVLENPTHPAIIEEIMVNVLKLACPDGTIINTHTELHQAFDVCQDQIVKGAELTTHAVMMDEMIDSFNNDLDNLLKNPKDEEGEGQDSAD